MIIEGELETSECLGEEIKRPGMNTIGNNVA